MPIRVAPPRLISEAGPKVHPWTSADAKRVPLMRMEAIEWRTNLEGPEIGLSPMQSHGVCQTEVASLGAPC